MIPETVLLTQIILATILGGIIGLERQRNGTPAGFRTHVLVCLGATLFTISSIAFPNASDPSRIAAGIVAGIGFIGAGAIFRARNQVKGITTAAELWVMAAIGIIIGIQYYSTAIITTVLILVIMLIGNKLKHPEDTEKELEELLTTPTIKKKKGK
ncbi:MAG: MgtC/SapB family protein [archaeon]